MDFIKEIEKNQEQLVLKIQELVRIDSVLEEHPDSKDAPFGEGIKKSLEYVLNLGKELGFKTKNVNNVAGHIEYGEGKEIIGVLCHVDVVPADGVWKYPPFSATIENNRIYGRGTNDDKGPVICSLFALKLLKDLNIKLNKRVRLIIGTDEETAWRGINEYLKNEEMPDMGFSPDADFPLIYGEKGILSFDVVGKNDDIDLIEFYSGKRYNVVPDNAYIKYNKDLQKEYNDYLQVNNLKGEIKDNKYIAIGKSAHAMMPEAGINSSLILANFLKNYSRNKLVQFMSDKLNDTRVKDMGLDFSDPEMKDLTMNLGIVRIDKNSSRIGLNFRYPINIDINKFIENFKKQAKEYDLDIVVKENKGPHYVDKNSDLIKVLHNAYIEYTGDTKTEIMTIGGGTYARAIKNAVAFGILFPGEEELAHQANEYINIDSAKKATAIIAKAIMDLGK